MSAAVTSFGFSLGVADAFSVDGLQPTERKITAATPSSMASIKVLKGWFFEFRIAISNL
jgi:hypothetical protein